ncbi:hypothetical protein ACULTK_003053 [Yersinia enterocolitica]|uniref:hypothetical protein n=3 Tax=Yersinia enterocolitica TaxID=630 RepID=UPI0005E74B5B|nr:hypothetical protein [Yersinia enterocolitica]MCV3313718.1 hypothetical protein [Yersinia enterocolitica]UYJ90062.1 hypothetical protein N4228_03800 [Yersinia enterocolitica]UYJ94094.1 hypothetical protein N4225_03795 [Yersinia enterocolitica]UYK23552.1 hypothetical protein N4223_03790 [Yersinia enterocolitica]UYK27531.1 hypothetical protein N4222_03790 [Yersinia enterocolitica]
MTLKNIVTISTLFIALGFFFFSVNTSLEVKELLTKYSLLNSKLVGYSSLAERIKMEKVSKSKVNDHLSDRVSNILNTLFNDGVINIKLTNMTQDYISFTIENSDIIKLIDIFFTLTQNKNIEISYLDVRFVESGDYINCAIILRKNYSKVSANVI